MVVIPGPATAGSRRRPRPPLPAPRRCDSTLGRRFPRTPAASTRRRCPTCPRRGSRRRSRPRGRGLPGHRDDGAQTVGGEIVFEAGEDPHLEGVVHGGEHDADVGRAAALAQSAGRGVEAEAELFCGRLDLGGGGAGDVLLPVEHAGGGLDAHTRALGDRGQRRPVVLLDHVCAFRTVRSIGPGSRLGAGDRGIDDSRTPGIPPSSARSAARGRVGNGSPPALAAVITQVVHFSPDRSVRDPMHRAESESQKTPAAHGPRLTAHLPTGLRIVPA